MEGMGGWTSRSRPAPRDGACMCVNINGEKRRTTNTTIKMARETRKANPPVCTYFPSCVYVCLRLNTCGCACGNDNVFITSTDRAKER